jgi:predicted transcriptional regulator
MRTTIRIPDPLLQEAKRLAAETGRTLTDVISDALRSAIARRHTSEEATPVTLPTFGEGGTLPGIDLSDSSSLLDAMESK